MKEMAEGSDEAAPVPPRTYGKKPHVFQFKERGKRYMIGTEVSTIHTNGSIRK